MGLFDSLGGGGGLLPFSDRWAPVIAALQSGQFDPQGMNSGGGLFGANGGALPYTAPQQPMPQLPPPINVPMPPQPATAGQGNGILAPAPMQPPAPQNAQASPAESLFPSSGGIGDRLLGALGGLVHGGSPLGGLSNAIQTLTTGQPTDPMEIRRQALTSTYDALRKIMPEPIARAAALNPEILKTIAPEYFGGYKVAQTGESPLGKEFKLQGPGGRFYDIPSNGAAPGAPAEGTPGVGGIGGGTAGGMMSLLAPGVAKYNPQLTGDDYMNQFGPEVQAAAKGWLRGDVMPTGNPRQQGIASLAKTIALKYAQDMGIPANDAIYSQKRKFFTELGSNAPNTAGGQSKAFVQGIEHAIDLGTTLKQLGNWNGWGIPILAQGANAVRQGLSTEQSAVADKASSIGQTLAGEVGKLFSGSQGGGVHERQLTRERFETVKSNPQLASALEATLEMMEGGLTAIEARRDADLGPNSGVEIIPQKTRERMNELRGIIAQLRGKPAAGSTEPVKPNGVKVMKWERGPDGVPRPVQQ